MSEFEMFVGLDFETYSPTDLRNEGLDNYVNDPDFKVLLAGIHLGDRPFVYDFVEDEAEAMESLRAAISGRKIVAHNAGFERAVLRRIGIDLPASRFIDTAVLARAAGAGGSLAASSAQLLGRDKMEEGVELIKLFCIPPADGSTKFDMSLPDRHPDEWALFKEYCMLDAMLSLDLHGLLYGAANMKQEIINSWLTMDMNETGWFVDLHAVEVMWDIYQDNLNAVTENFRNAVPSAAELNLNSTPQLIAWCKERGVRATSFDEKHVASMLKRVGQKMANAKDPIKGGPLSEVHQMLRVKQILGGSALKKLPTILSTTSKRDGRLRDQYLHVGADATYRTTGRGVQMQNLKRLNGEGIDMSNLTREHIWSNQVLAENMRQLFMAEHPQGQLIVGDFSSIESRALAWQAKEQWKLDAYHRGEDLYKVQAAAMFNLPGPDAVSKEQRQVGKVGELSCGYGAGPEAVRSFAEKMGVDLTEAESLSLVRDWRAANPEIVAYWAKLDKALHDSMDQANGRIRPAIFIGMAGDGAVLIRSQPAPESLRQQTGNQQLMSLRITVTIRSRVFARWIHGVHLHGRNICYWKPADRKTGDLWSNMYTDPKTKQRRRFTVYGGKLAGLLTQSLAREMFFHSLAKLYRETEPFDNLKIVGQFHDEIVMEWSPPTASDDASLTLATELLHSCMTDTPIPAFPLEAVVKHDHRYTK